MAFGHDQISLARPGAPDDGLISRRIPFGRDADLQPPTPAALASCRQRLQAFFGLLLRRARDIGEAAIAIDKGVGVERGGERVKQFQPRPQGTRQLHSFIDHSRRRTRARLFDRNQDPANCAHELCLLAAVIGRQSVENTAAAPVGAYMLAVLGSWDR